MPNNPLTQQELYGYEWKTDQIDNTLINYHFINLNKETFTPLTSKIRTHR